MSGGGPGASAPGGQADGPVRNGRKNEELRPAGHEGSAVYPDGPDRGGEPGGGCDQPYCGGQRLWSGSVSGGAGCAQQRGRGNGAAVFQALYPGGLRVHRRGGGRGGGDYAHPHQAGYPRRAEGDAAQQQAGGRTDRQLLCPRRAPGGSRGNRFL